MRLPVIWVSKLSKGFASIDAYSFFLFLDFLVIPWTCKRINKSGVLPQAVSPILAYSPFNMCCLHLRNFPGFGSLSFLLLYITLIFPASTRAQITVYGQIPLAQTLSASDPTATTLAAYNDTMLVPPPIPLPPPPNVYTLQLQRDASAVTGLSMPHVGASFFGFSIEMSVINQVCEYWL